MSEKQLIFERMALVMEDIQAIAKNQRNDFHKWNFRGIDDVYNAIHPLLSKHQIFCLSEVLESKRDQYKNAKGQNCIHAVYKYRYKFTTTDGSFAPTEEIGEAIDTNGDKASSKCASISHKYAIIKTFCIPTKDMEEPDKHAPYQQGGQPQNRAPNVARVKQQHQGQKVPPKKPAGYNPTNKAHQDALVLELEKRGVEFEKWDRIGQLLKGRSITELDSILKDEK